MANRIDSAWNMCIWERLGAELNSINMNTRVIFFIFFLLVVVAALLLTQNAKQKLVKKHTIACAEIISLYRSRGGPVAKFKYKCNGTVYTNEVGCLQVTIKKYEAGQNHIFVVLDKNYPNISFLLENADDFEKYHITKNDTTGENCY